MKQLVVFFIYTCFLLTPLARCAVIDFADPSIRSSLNQGEERQQELALLATPDDRQALRLAWKDSRQGFGELFLVEPIALPPQQQLELHVQLYVPAGSGLSSFNLRVVDATGETFQLPARLPALTHGWLSLSYNLNPASPPEESWGGNDNKIMELPLAVAGAGFDFRREVEQGHFFLSHLVYEAQTEKMAKEGELCLIDFAKQQPKISLHRAEELQHSYDYASPAEGEAKALSIIWQETPAGHYEFGIHENLPGMDFTSAIFHARVYFPSGNELHLFNLRLRDRHGEIFQYRVTLPEGLSGWQDISFPVNSSIPHASCWSGSVRNQRLDFPVSLHGFAGDFRKRGDKGSMAIAKVSMEVVADFRSLAPKLETGNPIHVLRPGEEDKLGLRIHNHKPHTVKGRLAYTMHDSRGQELDKQEQSLAVVSGNDFLLPLSAPKTQGAYYIDLRYVEEDIRVQPFQARYSFAAMQPAGPTPGRGKGFLFGVCSHPQRHPREHQELEAMAAAWCGAKILREDINWNLMQPAEDTWAFASFDFTVDAFAHYDIEMQAIYSYCARWAVAKDWQPLKPKLQRGARPDYEHWGRFIRAFAERYRNKVHYVEVWNEPDLHGFANFSAEEYIELMKIAYRETKAAAPEMSVLTAGFTCMPPYARLNDQDHMEKTLTLGRGYYDVHAFHGHGPYLHYRNQIERMLPFRERLEVTAPWYANETAISAMHIGDYRQAIVLFQKFLYSWARGSIGYNWYDLRNDGFDEQEGEHHFGLITKDFYPKTPYVTYNALANVYREASYIRDLDLPEQLHGFLFKSRDGDFLLPNWNMDSRRPSRLFVLTGISGQASHIDMFGNERPLKVVNQAVVINIDREPSSIRISGQEQEPGIAGDFLEQVAELSVIAGEDKQLAFSIRNPTAFTLATDISLLLPTGISCAQQGQHIELAPNTETLCVFELAIADDFRSVPGAQKEITVDARFGALWQGRFACPVHSMTVVAKNAGFGDEPHFVLNDAAQNTMLVPNAPDMAKLRWSGPEDLSAQVWLAHDGEQLQLRALVRDDIHQQPYSGAEVWKGDNIQIAIALAGSQPFWEIGFTLDNEGKQEVFIWQTPAGFDTAAAIQAIALQVERDEAKRTTHYQASIPLAAIGLSAELAAKGFRFNLLVNDNDGDVREGYHAIAPGLGTGKDSRLFPQLILR